MQKLFWTGHEVVAHMESIDRACATLRVEANTQRMGLLAWRASVQQETMSGFSSKRCPISAEIVRDWREVFGDDCKVFEVKENGYEFKAKDAVGVDEWLERRPAPMAQPPVRRAPV